MSAQSFHVYLDGYLSVREALGFQMRAERTLLRDFVNYLATHADAGPLRAHLAVDWACAASAAGEKAPHLRPAADQERSNTAPSCCQGGGPRHARLRLRVAAVPLRALDSGRCVAL